MSQESTRRIHPVYTVMLAIVWLQPVLHVTSTLLAGVAAQIEIGHWPRPSMDDPSGMGLAVQVFKQISFISLLGVLGTVVQGVILTPIYFAYFNRTRSAVWVTASYAAACLLALWFAFIDPIRLIEWMLD